MEILKTLQDEFGLKLFQVENTIKLIDQGNTIPFIARYRKEATGNLSDDILREFDNRYKYLIKLDEKKQEIINSIDNQGKLTAELKTQIENSKTQAELTDIYRPFKQKKHTRSDIAKQKGLEKLANIIIDQKDTRDIEIIAKEFVKKNKDEKLSVNSTSDAIEGALDIIASQISDDPKFRKYIKNQIENFGQIVVELKSDDNNNVYSMYKNYKENIKYMASHRILAINRGEKEDQLKVKIVKDDERIIKYISNNIIKKESKFEDLLLKCITDSYHRLIEPSIDREIRNNLFEKAQDKSINVFGKNIKQLLLQPPIKNKVVMGFDPGYRTGCKIAIIDDTGKYLASSTIYPTEPVCDIENSKKEIYRLIKEHNVDLIALGNGTASRESEEFIANLIQEKNLNTKYIIVSEAGASVYSASELASMEYPDLNVSIRGAISIARRLQDPLIELVKIDPKSIGVGQYQHDMDQNMLSESLKNVVEDSVNNVGVDLNTATSSLLKYVSGINKTIAKNIVSYRDENGKFKDRKDLLKVKSLGKNTYNQCAGFLRIYNGDNPFDSTAVHPESYEKVKQLLNILGFEPSDLIKKDKLDIINDKLKALDVNCYSKDLEIGEYTLKDIIDEISKPGRDIRENMPKPILRSDVLKFEDLKIGMVLKGTIRNVVDFGAFVDIGIKNDGLVHLSEMSNNYIKSPYDIISIGDIIDVKVINIDDKKRKVSLSMKIDN